MLGGYDTDTVIRLETNLDDSSPEILGATMDKLLAAGALDVWLTPIHMKKNRPGVSLSVLSAKSRTWNRWLPSSFAKPAPSACAPDKSCGSSWSAASRPSPRNSARSR